MRRMVAGLAGAHFQTADLLRHNGADTHVQGRYVMTPLHDAAYYDNLNVVQKLIEYEADIHAEDRDGWTPFYWGSRGLYFKDGSALRLLLECGADVNARAKNGQTPLHEGSSNGVLKVVRLLLEHGADVEAKDNYGKTALQCAGGRRKGEVVKLLREHGAK